MTRSEVNQIVHDSLEFCREMNFNLPPFGYWTAEEWQEQGPEWDEVRENMLGWDITDFGSNDFARVGLVLFTIRNGNMALADKYPKPYCEKLLIVCEDQYTPCHYHFNKMEDIICRAGGNLMVKAWWRDEQDGLSDRDVEVVCDGRRFTVAAGETIRLRPGESITLPAYLYHTFWGEAGAGKVLVGEVSKVNDDLVDNRFLEELPRFSDIVENEPPTHLLCSEYPAAR